MSYRESNAPNRSIVVVALQGRLAGIDRHTGKEVWRNALEGGGLGAVTLAIDGDNVYAAAAALFCVEYATGKLRWSAALSGASGRATVLVDEGLIFVGRLGELDCFNTAGQRVWHQGLTGMGVDTMAIGLPGNVAQADTRG